MKKLILFFSSYFLLLYEYFQINLLIQTGLGGNYSCNFPISNIKYFIK